MPTPTIQRVVLRWIVHPIRSWRTSPLPVWIRLAVVAVSLGLGWGVAAIVGPPHGFIDGTVRSFAAGVIMLAVALLVAKTLRLDR
jgi:hypothetical protein